MLILYIKLSDYQPL